MKFLQAAVLSAILVSCVTGSVRTPRYFKSPTSNSPKSRKRATRSPITRSKSLGQAVGKTVKVENQNTIAKSYAEPRSYEQEIDHIIQTKSSTSIAKFINQTGQANTLTLHKLCEGRSVETINRVLERVNFSQADLADRALLEALACEPGKFLALLNKITAPKDQESVTREGIESLISCRHKRCLPHVLEALKSKTFKSKHLENIVAQELFEKVVKADVYEPGVLWCTFEHPVITHRIYAEGLMASAKHRLPNQTFRWLLEKADNGDLRAFQAKTGYADLRADLLVSVDLAMPKTLDGRTRLSVTIPENKPEAASKVASTSTNRGAFGHFHAYMTDRDETAREFGYSPFKV